MLSQYVIVDLNKSGSMSANRLQNPPDADAVVSHLVEQVEHATIYQITTNDLFTRPELQMQIWWDVIVPDPKPEDYVPTEKEKFILALMKLYAEKCKTYAEDIRHTGYTTTIKFKMKDGVKHQDDLSWLSM